ncbi:hypothetical protein [Streptomyces sp. NPDC007088]|uniref:hypothetical protein n=1 Tax=Streptomyces sp. NPDC007088 TaxID=3364773 RepID=UPI0036BC3B2B
MRAYLWRLVLLVLWSALVGTLVGWALTESLPLSRRAALLTGAVLPVACACLALVLTLRTRRRARGLGLDLGTYVAAERHVREGRFPTDGREQVAARDQIGRLDQFARSSRLPRWLYVGELVLFPLMAALQFAAGRPVTGALMVLVVTGIACYPASRRRQDERLRRLHQRADAALDVR